MKKIILPILSAFLPFFLSAQLTLEHTYPAYAAARVNLEISGIKYYYADAESRKLLLFNEDHTPWKTVDVNITIDSVWQIQVSDVSQTRIMADTLIEFRFFYKGGNNGYFVNGGGVQNEAGTILINKSSALYTINGADKLFSDDRVYQLPGLALEHDYSYGHLVLHAIDAEVYTYSVLEPGKISLYHYDHSLWKTINYDPACSNCTAFISAISQISVDPDPDFELLLQIQRYNPQQTTLRIVKEDGSIIWEKNSDIDESIYCTMVGSAFGVDETKLVTFLFSKDSTIFYSLPDLSVETKLPFLYRSLDAEQEGRKCNGNNTPIGASTMDILNLPTFDIWHSFAKPADEIWYPSFFSRHLMDSDDDIEFGYLTSVASPDTGGLRIRDETDGSILLEEQYVWDALIDVIPGEPTKLIYTFENINPAQIPTPRYTKVYALGGMSGLPIVSSAPDLSVIGSPNPGAGDVWLDFSRIPDQDLNVRVYDLTGKAIFTRQFAPSESLLLP